MIIKKIESHFGKMTVTRGSDHVFLGMNIHYNKDAGTATIKMTERLPHRGHRGLTTGHLQERSNAGQQGPLRSVRKSTSPIQDRRRTFPQHSRETAVCVHTGTYGFATGHKFPDHKSIEEHDTGSREA